MIVIQKSEAERDLSSVFNSAVVDGEEVLIESDKGNAVLISETEFHNLKEHIHVSKSKKLMHKIHNKEDLDYEEHADIDSLKNGLDN